VYSLILYSLIRNLHKVFYSPLKTDKVSQNTIDEVVKAARINGPKHVEMNRTVDAQTIDQIIQSAGLENSEFKKYKEIISSPKESLIRKRVITRPPPT